jgi:hypothetical protein
MLVALIRSGGIPVTEQPDLPDPSSDAWAKVECDIAVWVPCPLGFPPGYDRERWAWKSDGEREQQLRSLTHADDPDAVRPPVVDEVKTERAIPDIDELGQVTTIVPVTGRAGAEGWSQS